MRWGTLSCRPRPATAASRGPRTCLSVCTARGSPPPVLLSARRGCATGSPERALHDRQTDSGTLPFALGVHEGSRFPLLISPVLVPSGAPVPARRSQPHAGERGDMETWEVEWACYAAARDTYADVWCPRLVPTTPSPFTTKTRKPGLNPSPGRAAVGRISDTGIVRGICDAPTM
jgi:hypothetical protein